MPCAPGKRSLPQRRVAGEHVLARFFTAGRVSHVLPVTVVEDSEQCLALYLAAGTTMLRPQTLDGSLIPRDAPYALRFNTPWKLGEGVWHTHDRLFLSRPGAAHAVSLFWKAETREFIAWYVDMLAPFRRGPHGFDSEDHVLDIVVRPDFAWHWKDEDELEDARRAGRFSAHEAAAIRAEGARAADAIDARRWPYDAGWERWNPEASWSVPRLPDDIHESSLVRDAQVP